MTTAPRWFLALEQVTRTLNRAFVIAASALIVLIVALVLLGVGARVLGRAILWPHDIAQFALVYVFFLGLAPALESGHHIVVELFDRLVPAPVRAFVDYIAALAVLVFGCILFWQLWKTTARAFADNRLAISAMAVPLKWIYVIGPIGTAQFLLSGLVQLGRARYASTEPRIEGE